MAFRKCSRLFYVCKHLVIYAFSDISCVCVCSFFQWHLIYGWTMELTVIDAMRKIRLEACINQRLSRYLTILFVVRSFFRYSASLGTWIVEMINIMNSSPVYLPLLWNAQDVCVLSLRSVCIFMKCKWNEKCITFSTQNDILFQINFH